MKPLVVMACALGCYGIAEMIRHESGIMAVVAAGVTMGRWAWGSKFVDLNNDGLQDLVVPNGLVTSDETRDL